MKITVPVSPVTPIQAYLDRIGYRGSQKPDSATLCALHRAHLLRVPFENLDIHLGRIIVLDEDRFFAKIVGEGRGGFCYELNGLFAWLLSRLGFRVHLLSARVYDDGQPGPPFDHMALHVECGGVWLADVGFGDSFIEPLPLGTTDVRSQRGIGYRVDGGGALRTLMRCRSGGEWAPVYEFDLQPRRLEEFAAMCRWHQESPASHFTRKRLCTMATAEGRMTLGDDRLILTEHGLRREDAVSSEKEYLAVLKTHFGIELPRGAAWIRRWGETGSGS